MMFNASSYLTCLISTGHVPLATLLHPSSPFSSESPAVSRFTPLR
ncbi:hypothetical protein SAMN04490203_2909 [Pseudomonas taetrolens]|uniref:Uncharacterized protein n=1 Tax=Pseudomonas taetrolens TaxID=47884 RepID=A0A1H4UJ58_PSETA|nr:hypothetical protein SAMN04490203_2909 [Pseudomonas taetrolens]VEH50130.1 Uncharacterised protein [Pseudomonas taetrolens]